MLKEEIKLALVLDNYKIPMKEKLWAEAIAKIDDISSYMLIREKKKPGPVADTTTLIRYYKLTSIKEHSCLKN